MRLKPMQTQITKLTALVLLALLAVGGCKTPSSTAGYPRSLNHVVGKEIMAFGGNTDVSRLYEVEWTSCKNEADAEIVAVCELSIPEVILPELKVDGIHAKKEYPIRRIFSHTPYEAFHIKRMYGGATKGGRAIYKTRLYELFWLEFVEEKNVAHVDYSWKDNGKQGGLKADLPVTIGVDEEWALSDTARLKISYRKGGSPNDQQAIL